MNFHELLVDADALHLSIARRDPLAYHAPNFHVRQAILEMGQALRKVAAGKWEER